MNHEDISALVDEEVDDATRARLLDALGEDAAARRTWGRYHVIGDMLRTMPATPAKVAAPRVLPAAVVPLPRRARGLRGPLTGLAVAASVTLVAVLLVNAGAPSLPGPEVAAVALSPAPAGATVATVGTERDLHLVPAGTFDERLDGYLVNFNEQRARLGVPGVHPYVRIVGFDAR